MQLTANYPPLNLSSPWQGGDSSRNSSSGVSLDSTYWLSHYRTKIDNCPVFTFLQHNLSPQDIKFINVSNATGEPLDDGGLVQKLAMYLYPKAGEGESPEFSYCSQKMADDLVKTTEGMQALASNQYLPQEERDRIKETIKNTTQMIETQAAKARDQLVLVLNEAKLVLAQRGVDKADPQVLAVMDIIDIVLEKMGRYSTFAKEAQDPFFAIYFKDTKMECEREIAKARNPFPLVNKFCESCKNPDKSGPTYNPFLDERAMSERYESAMDTVRPQARIMAQELTELLRPFAKYAQEGGNGTMTTSKGVTEVPFRLATALI